MPFPRRTDSDTTHVSDSEPEREAYRRDNSPSSSSNSSAPNTPSHRSPLSTISDNTLGTRPDARNTLESRLTAIEGDLAEIKDKLGVQSRRKRKLLVGNSSPSTPPPKRVRIMRNKKVGCDSPVGRLEEPRIHRSSLMASTPEREDIARCLSEALQPASAKRSIPSRRTG
ncbi:hypothetical protein B0H14DRAFT_3162395 [Mycena olivaceomarginata]|nr:hypothetical protein B0H14DRAFT_3162395 [Mycena olivaceomarginata]